jgi:hypothetical protein
MTGIESLRAAVNDVRAHIPVGASDAAALRAAVRRADAAFADWTRATAPNLRGTSGGTGR